MPEIGIAHLGRLAEEAADPGGLPRGASPTTAASTRRRAGHRQRAQRLAAGRPVQANVSSVARENSNGTAIVSSPTTPSAPSTAADGYQTETVESNDSDRARPPATATTA